jgi:hypothetical protein
MTQYRGNGLWGLEKQICRMCGGFSLLASLEAISIAAHLTGVLEDMELTPQGLQIAYSGLHHYVWE